MRLVVTLVVSEPVEPFRPISCESTLFFCCRAKRPLRTKRMLLFSEGALSEPNSLSAQLFFLFCFLLSAFNKPCLISFLLLVLVQMSSRKRRASNSQPQDLYDTSRFISEVTWERYEQNIQYISTKIA